MSVFSHQKGGPQTGGGKYEGKPPGGHFFPGGDVWFSQKVHKKRGYPEDAREKNYRSWGGRINIHKTAQMSRLRTKRRTGKENYERTNEG